MVQGLPGLKTWEFYKGEKGKVIRIVREDGPRGFVSLRAHGHAGFDDNGRDIVCASISTLIQAWLGNLHDLLGDQIKIEAVQDDGYLKFKVPGDIEEMKRIEVERIARYFYRPLIAFSDQYPDNLLVTEISQRGETLWKETVKGQE